MELYIDKVSVPSSSPETFPDSKPCRETAEQHLNTDPEKAIAICNELLRDRAVGAGDFVAVEGLLKQAQTNKSLSEAEEAFQNGSRSAKETKQFCLTILASSDEPSPADEARVKNLLNNAEAKIAAHVESVIISANSIPLGEHKEQISIDKLVNLLIDYQDDLGDEDCRRINASLVDLIDQSGVMHPFMDYRDTTIKYEGVKELIDLLKTPQINFNTEKKIREAYVKLAKSAILERKRILSLVIASAMDSVESSFKLTQEYKNYEYPPEIKGIPLCANGYAKIAEQQAIEQGNTAILILLSEWYEDGIFIKDNPNAKRCYDAAVKLGYKKPNSDTDNCSVQ